MLECGLPGLFSMGSILYLTTASIVYVRLNPGTQHRELCVRH